MEIATLGIQIAILVALVAIAFLLWQRSSYGITHAILRRSKASDAPASREVLPMSTIGGRGFVREVFVFDAEKNAFRRVGEVDANGVGRSDDGAGDGISLVQGKLYRIVGRPQRVAFRPERVNIGKGTTPNGAADWVVHDIAVGHRSQFAQSGPIPGDMFGSQAIDSFVSFDTIQTAMDFSMDVSYQGPNPSEPFTCAVLGTAAS